MTESPPQAVRLEARELVHRFGRRPVLDRLSFSLDAPGVVAVRGANGSGKTTLLRILAGLLRPTGGATSLSVEGREVALPARPRRVGYAGPDISFYPELTGVENLAFAAETRGLASPREAAGRALERVGLASRGADRVGALSSGMVQRLRLAFAWLHDPPVILLDEPGSFLDEEGRTKLAELVGIERGRRLVLIATNEDREGELADQRIELQGRGLGHSA